MKKHSIIIMALMLALVLAFAGCSNESKTALGIPAKEVNEVSEIVVLDEIVGFGQYEQDNNVENGKEVLEWRIVAKDNTKALLVCESAIEAMPYDAAGANAWETSSLRAWLNGEFIKTAFTAEEAERMLSATSVNEGFGANTMDKVFILDANEIATILENNFAVRATNFAAENGAWNDSELNCRWWVRNPAADSGITTAAYADGNAVVGINASYDMVGVRPAVIVKLKDATAKSAADFTTDMEKLEYTVTDVAAGKSETVTAVTSAKNSDYAIELYEYVDAEVAKTAFAQEVEALKAANASRTSERQLIGSNFEIYEFSAGENYYIVSKIDASILKTSTTADKKDALVEVIKGLGYANVM